MLIESGKTYLVAYGNGSQLFHIVRISKAGKPFGFRYFPSEGWKISTMKANDDRFRGLAPLPLHPPTIPKGFVKIDAFPPVFESKADVKALTAAEKAANKVVKAHEASKNPALDFTGPEYKTRYDAYKASPELQAESSAFTDKGNELRSTHWDIVHKLNPLKAENTLVSAKTDVESAEFETWIEQRDARLAAEGQLVNLSDKEVEAFANK